MHLDSGREDHNRSVCQAGVFDRAMTAIRAAKAAGVDGITISPGYAYERAPDQTHFLNRRRTKNLFRAIFTRSDRARRWRFAQSPLFLDFLPGNQTYHCTPWGNPTRNVFGWRRLLPAGRGLRAELPRPDGRDGLGRLRYRPL